MEHQGIEFHDSTVHAILQSGEDATLKMNVYVHSSAGRPGWDHGRGWFQDAEIVIAGAEVTQRPDGDLLDIHGGSVRVAGQLFENLLPLPCDIAGKVEIVLSGQQGELTVKGMGIRVALTGSPGPVEEFGA